MAGEIAYADTSALVKLVIEERESTSLRHFLADRRLASSLVGAVELSRTVRRVLPSRAAEEQVREVLARLDLIAFNSDLASRAAGLDPPALRSLDAIHLATALSLGEDLGVFVAYDDRLLRAARRLRLPVEAPC